MSWHLTFYIFLCNISRDIFLIIGQYGFILSTIKHTHLVLCCIILFFFIFFFSSYVEKYKVIKENKRKKKPARNTFMLCWENLHLHALHPSWFVVHKYELTRIELGRNRLSKLNEDLFTLLVHLEELDVSCNLLTSIPTQSLASSKLVFH